MSGQTPAMTAAGCRARGGFNGGPDNCPARRLGNIHLALRLASFNGGPDNCPARQRARFRTLPKLTCFNGGPDNCPARPEETAEIRGGDGASMEGRTIVRPDRSRILGWFTCVFAGVCERCWKPKLRRELIQLSSCKKLPQPGFECSLGLGNAT